MPDNIQKPKRGRPKRVFTPKILCEIAELAKLQCHTRTIAETLGYNEIEFRRNKSIVALLKQKRAEGRTEIHKAQHNMLEKQPVMAIWLGKQHLGQSDTQKVEISGMPPVVVQLQSSPESSK